MRDSGAQPPHIPPPLCGGGAAERRRRGQLLLSVQVKKHHQVLAFTNYYSFKLNFPKIKSHNSLRKIQVYL